MKKLSLVLGLVVFAIGSMLAQKTVTGTISDQNGDPLLGASILVKGTTTGTITDIDGAYSVNVKDDNAVFVVSYTGFETMEVEVGNQTTLDITMAEGINLQEVVVAALGIERQEKALGYSVQEVSGAELAETKEVNVVNSLNGKVAGIQIQGSPSSLGGSSRITIRGSNSFLGNNQPLFVVDGIPLDNSNFATSAQERGFGGGTAYDYGNTIQDIDPESIESMTVLKGAAASALYGQRGANGVILITTKDGSGRKGKGIGVEVSSSMTFDQVNNLIPHQQEYGGGALNPNTPSGFNTVIQDGQEYLYPSYSKDGSWGPKYDPNVLVRHWDSWDPGSPNYKEERPWVAPGAGYEDFFETGTTLQNSVALSGANEQGNFRLGFTNLSQDGTMPNGELERNTLTFNSGYQIHDRVRVEIAGNYIRTDAQNRNVTGYNNGNPMQAFTQWWQTQLDMDRLQNDVRTDGFQQTWNARGPQKDGNNLLFYDEQPNFFDNPYWVRNNFLQEDTRNRFFGNGQVVVDLAEGLSLSGRAGTDFYQFSTREGIPIQSVETSYYGEEERRFQETNMEVKLSYAKDFDRVTLNVVGGGNRMRQFIRRSSAETNGGLALDGFYNISNSLASPIVSTNEQEWGINSFFGLASIGLDNWLYLDVTARNDWSSTLPDGENSYFYPSVSLSAVITDLPMFGGAIGPISFAKVRASYAQVGLDADPYRLRDVFSPQVPNYMGNPRYAVPNGQNNPNLGPELTSEYEFGLDLRMFNGRMGLDVAYYDRSTKDQIFRVPASGATGFTSKILNAGEMRNYGVEFQLNLIPVETQDFQWNITLNALRQYNEVVSLADGVESIARGGTWAADLRIAEGLPYMAIFGQDYVYNDDGERLVTEDGFYQFTSERVFLGSAIADWTGGLQTGFRYKGLFGSVLFDFQKGGAIHSTSLQWSKYSGMHPETISFNGVDDVRADGLILPGVKPDGTPNDIAVDPQTYYQTYWNRAAPNVYEASFVKLRDVRLGYKIPNRLFGKAPFRDVTLSVFGRNLAILTADLPYLDPQIITGAGNDQGLENAQIPSTRSMGVNLSFKL